MIGSPGCWGEWRNGRRAGFRCQCPSGRGGSSPPSPTIEIGYRLPRPLVGVFLLCSGRTVAVDPADDVGHLFDVLPGQPYRRDLSILQGRCAHLAGCDVDEAVLENPHVDHAGLRPGSPVPRPHIVTHAPMWSRIFLSKGWISTRAEIRHWLEHHADMRSTQL